MEKGSAALVIPQGDVGGSNDELGKAASSGHGQPNDSLVDASTLVRKATPAEARRQKLIMNGFSFAYSLVVSFSLSILFLWLLGSSVYFACALGLLLGIFYGPALVWLLKRSTGFTGGLRSRSPPKAKKEEEEDDTEVPTSVETSDSEEQMPKMVSVIDAAEGPTSSCLPEAPPQFFRKATDDEVALCKEILCHYGLVLFLLGSAPLVALISWQSGFLYSGLGCFVGYAMGCLNYPLSLSITACWTKSEIVWIHKQLVCIQEEPVRDKNTAAAMQTRQGLTKKLQDV